MKGKVWVGVLDDVLLVFDEEIQLENSPHVFLWNVQAKEMQKYDPALLKKWIQKATAPSVIDAAESEYTAFKPTVVKEWLDIEIPRTRMRIAKDLENTPEFRHKSKMNELGKKYLGVRVSARKRPHRVTICYACRATLDNTMQLECAACGWIICGCGACGCGYDHPA